MAGAFEGKSDFEKALMALGMLAGIAAGAYFALPALGIGTGAGAAGAAAGAVPASAVGADVTGLGITTGAGTVPASAVGANVAGVGAAAPSAFGLSLPSWAPTLSQTKDALTIAQLLGMGQKPTPPEARTPTVTVGSPWQSSAPQIQSVSRSLRQQDPTMAMFLRMLQGAR